MKKVYYLFLGAFLCLLLGIPKLQAQNSSYVIVDTLTIDVWDVHCSYSTNTGSAIQANPAVGLPGPYTYFWTGPSINLTNQNNQNLNSIFPGNYNLTFTFNNGTEQIVQTVTVGIPPAITVAPVVQNVTCNNLGSISVIINGGTSPYLLSWYDENFNGVGSTTTINNLNTGLYSLFITDANNCFASTSQNVGTDISSIQSINVTDVKCYGQNSGKVSIVMTGAAPYSYIWSDGTNVISTNDTLNNRPAGTYYVTIIDGNSCTYDTVATILQPAIALEVVPSAPITNVTCSGGNDGSISVQGNGGTAPYGFLWDNGSTNSTISNLTAGDYPITIYDANNCSTLDTFTVTEENTAIQIIGLTGPTKCFQSSDGTVLINQVIINGANNISDFSFAWSDGSTGTSITGPAGNYTVTVTHIPSGCTESNIFTINDAAQIIPNLVGHSIDCQTLQGGAAAHVSGGNPPFNYVWSGTPSFGQGTDSVTYYNTTGWFYVTITDINSCQVIDSVFINPAVYPVLSNTSIDVACHGDATGSIDLTVTSGLTPYDYNWSNLQITEDLVNIQAGTYYVTVTDALHCSSIDSVTIDQPTELNVTINGDIFVCNGTQTSLNAIVNGGTSGYLYQWNNGNNTLNNFGIGAGSYSVTVTDANLCTANASQTVFESSPLVITGVETNVSCYNFGDGEIDLSISGGTYSNGNVTTAYLWNTGATTEDITNLIPGNYSVTVTNTLNIDGTVCTGIQNFSITQPDSLEISAFTVTDVDCNGNSTGAIDITVIQGTPQYSYSWTGGSTTQDINGLLAGTYTVNVEDINGCTVSGTYVVSQPDQLGVTINGDIFVCNGTTTDLSAAPSGGVAPYLYNWNNFVNSNNNNNLLAGNYSVTITDQNSCTATANQLVSQSTPLVVSGIETNVSCYNFGDGEIDLSVSGGTYPTGNVTTTYLWNTGATTEDIMNLIPGNYSVTVTNILNIDGTVCTDISNYTITQPDSLEISAFTVTDVDCNGNSTGAIDITVIQGTPQYSYSWTGGSTTQDINGLIAGTYTVNVEDINGCTVSGTYDISQPDQLGVTINGDIFVCNGTTTDLSAAPSGGVAPYIYNWNNFVNTNNNNSLLAGNYSVTITDFNGCTASASQLVSQSTPLVVSGNETNVSCYNFGDGEIDLSVSGGFYPTGNVTTTYLWSTGATTEDIMNLVPGNYSVTVNNTLDIDGTVCTDISNYAITQPDSLEISAFTITDVDCNGNSTGAIDITVIQGTPQYSYSWTGGGTTQDINGLIAGTYTVNVEDVNGCTVSGTYIIAEPDQLGVTINGDIFVCNGTTTDLSAAPSGGVAPYLYNWNNFVNSNNNNSLLAGNYSVTITDFNGCTASAAQVVSESTPLVVNGTETNVSCYNFGDGEIDLSVSGGIYPTGNVTTTYLWSTGATTEDIMNLVPGNYSVTVNNTLDIDGTICTDVSNYVITQPDSLEISAFTLTDVDCNGNSTGAIDITVIQGTPQYSYSWTGGSTTQDINGLIAGTYTVNVEDANGCTVSGTYVIAEPDQLGVTINGDIFVCNGTTTDLSAAPSGGVAPYLYNWNNLVNSNNNNSLLAGNYSVTITDFNGCTASAAQVVSESTPLVVSGTETNVSCYNFGNGEIDLSVSGGIYSTGNVTTTYLWSTGATTEDIMNLVPGNYSVTVNNTLDIDGTVCTDISNYVITQPDSLEISAFTLTDVDCNGNSTGAIDITVIQGTPQYSYSWTGGSTTQDINGLIAGTYTVNVEDINGCTVSGTYIIAEPDQLGVTINGDIFVCNGTTTDLSAAPSGGVAPYLYNWNNLINSNNNNSLLAGNYSVTITDFNGCTASAAQVVSESTPLVVSGTETNVSCYNFGNGEIDLSVSGGIYSTGNVTTTYLWSTGATTEDIMNLVPGNYSVTVNNTLDIDGTVCTDISNYVITQPDSLEISAFTLTDVDCNGNSTGAIDITVIQGTPQYSYSWTGGSTTQDINGLIAGTYTVNVEDANGCTVSGTYVIAEPDQLGVTINGDIFVCNGTTTDLSAAPSGGVSPYGYNWNNGTSISNNNGLFAGNYSVTITDFNGCTASATQFVSESDPINISFIVEDVLCGGIHDSTGSIELNYTGGWASNNTNSITWITPWSNPAVDGTYNDSSIIPEAIVGNYLVTVYSLNTIDGTVCSANSSATINNPVNPIHLGNLVGDIFACYGDVDTVEVTGAGGWPPYTYSFDGVVNTTGIFPGITADNTYELSIWDTNGCASITSVTVYQPPQLVISGITTDASCFGLADGSIDLSVSGGFYSFDAIQTYSYNWNGVNANTEDVVVSGGIYEVTVTSDVRGCTETASFTINEPNQILVSNVVSPVTCHGADNGAIDVTVVGGIMPYTYIWSNGEITEDVTNLAGNNTYNLTITDANGCTADYGSYFPVALSSPDPIEISWDPATSVLATDCYGDANGFVKLIASGGAGGYMFDWYDGSTGDTIANLAAGYYGVTVTDNNMCTQSRVIQISGHDPIIFNYNMTEPLCHGDANGTIDLFINGGAYPYNYNWYSDNGFNSNSSNIDSIAAGNYTIVITDILGCKDSTIINVTEPCPLSSTLYGGVWNPGTSAMDITDSIGSQVGMIDNFVCCGTYPYSYLWSNNMVTEDASNLGPGTYTVTVTDAHGCNVSSSFTFFGYNTPVWFYSIQESNHVIHIPNSAVNSAIGIGDYFGVFYDSTGTGVLACAGYARYNGVSTTITAWGNDATTSQKDGYDINEEFQWRIWDATNGYDYPALVNYDLINYQNDSLYNDNGISGLTGIEFDPTYYVDTQYINLNNGWNIISTYIELSPSANMASDMLASLFADSTMIIFKNDQGEVVLGSPLGGPLPFFDFQIKSDEGYLIKMNANNTLGVAGQEYAPETETIVLDFGWSIISYLRKSETSIVDIMSDSYNYGANDIRSSIKMVKNTMGQVYWPEMNIDLIGNMKPGEGYRVKMKNASSFVYPPNGYLNKSASIIIKPEFYKNIYNTDQSMTIGIPVSSWETEPTMFDEIGIFNSNNLLVGSGVFTGSNMAITAWGNDENSKLTDGMLEDEKFTIRLWNKESNSESIIEITQWDEGSEFYSKDAISIAGKSTMIEANSIIAQNNPNPFKNSTEISFYLNQDSEITIGIYNSLGDLTEVIAKGKYTEGEHIIKFDAKKYAAGIYQYKISGEGFQLTNTMSIIK